MPLLTVHETLLFARRCMWASGCKNLMEAEAEKVGGHPGSSHQCMGRRHKRSQ